MKYKSTMHNLDKRQCYLCEKLHGDYSEKLVIHHHHVFGGPYKKASEKYGFIVNLCPFHHVGDISGNQEAVHGAPDSKRYSDMLKKDAQGIFEEDHPRNDFIRIFGKSRL